MTLEAGVHDLRPEGKISHCASCIAECHYFCCDFDPDPTSGNFMVMYPGELDRAMADGWDVSNVAVLGPDADGGLRFTTPHRVCCQLPPTGSGDAPGTHNFYKSFECRVYPLWPYLHNEQWRFRISERCPIHLRDLDMSHKVDEILAEVRQLVADPRVKRWFQHQRCAGKYKEYPTRYDTPRQVAILPPEVTASSVVYTATAGGRVFRYGVRGAEEIKPALRDQLSEMLLACVVADFADSDYITIHRPVTAAQLASLRELVAHESEAARGDAGAPLPIVRAIVSDDVVPSVGHRGSRPSLEIVDEVTAVDGYNTPLGARMHAARRQLLDAIRA